MSYNRFFEVNEEQAFDFLENTINKIRTEEDIDTLTKLIKVFKKNVPFSMRKYVTAFLLKESLKHYHSFRRPSTRQTSFKKRNDRSFRNDYRANTKTEKSFTNTSTETTETEERVKHQRVQIDADKATSIFLSIGKNRRVYPRDLVGLLVAVAGFDRDRIGDIKVLANYSFVQLYTEDAQTAIDKLNGYDYRGRKLVVSYSNQKSKAEDETSFDSDSEYDNYSDGYYEDESMAQEDAAAYAAAEKAASDKEPFSSFGSSVDSE